MPAALFRFYPDLNVFLRREDRDDGAFQAVFENGQSLKHLIEAAGVPHTEVGRMQANGAPVDFSYPVQDGDRLEIYPAAPGDGLPPGPPRFVLDGHLGRLAAFLRMLGVDTLYRNDFTDPQLAEISAAEDRILLTRDRRLLMRKSVRRGYCLRSLDTFTQLREVLRRYELFEKITPFQRCLRCNTILEPVSKAEVLDRLEPLTRQYYDDFHRCPNCAQIYWKGSHYERMLAVIDRLRADGSPPR